MKAKSASVTCFRYFIAMTDNLFGATIIYFQSDGALEVTKGDFKKLLDEYEIVSRLS